MFDLVQVLCCSGIAAAIAYFIGWMNGCNDGMEEERKRNYTLQREKESKNIYFL